MLYSLRPVSLRTQAPDGNTAFADSFAAPGGRVIELHPDDAFRVMKFLQRSRTSVVTSDGTVLFALRGTTLVECSPAAATLAVHEIRALFIPLEWIAGQPVPVGSPEAVDVTKAVLQIPLADLRTLTDCSPTANALVDPEDRAHYGPHQVVCVNAIARFFGVSTLTDLTQEMMDAMPSRPTLMPLDDPNPEPLWMLSIGEEQPRSMSCRAPDILGAIRKGLDMFPGQPVCGAFSIA